MITTKLMIAIASDSNSKSVISAFFLDVKIEQAVLAVAELGRLTLYCIPIITAVDCVLHRTV